MTPQEEAALKRQLRAIRKSLEHTLEMARFVLALRIAQDHGYSLGEALERAQDLARVRELYPE